MSNQCKLIGNNFECFPLKWDTDYFGVKSARVNLAGIIDEDKQNKILEYCKQFEFVTISNLGNSKENNYWIGKNSNAFLADINIQFTKEVSKESEWLDESTEIHNAYPLNRKIIDIAGSAFRYSRFFNDPALPKKQSDNIYLHWTECAFGQNNKYFIVSKRNNEIAGYILFSIDKDSKCATIELIAVDENFRGQKVGNSMIAAMESFCYRNGIVKIKVGTQVDNIVATQFYNKCGFRYVSCGAVYHLWMENSK